MPINAGCFEPLVIADPHNTFLYARYPRPVSGCAAEVSSRIRLNGTQRMVAYCELSDGTFWSTAVDITVLEAACTDGT